MKWCPVSVKAVWRGTQASPAAEDDAAARGCLALGRLKFAVRSRPVVFQQMRGITAMGAVLLHSVASNGYSVLTAALQVDEC